MKLHPYQLEGAKWLASRTYAFLADEPGLGKSAQAVTAAGRLPQRGDSGHFLIVCPAAARRNWAREWSLWCSKFSLLPAVLEKLGEPIPNTGPVIITYDFARECRAALAAHHWDALILDEAQAARNGEAGRTKALFGVRGIARSASRVWWLTGTPIEHHPDELWLPMYFAGATKIRKADWIGRFCLVAITPMGERVVGANHAAIPQLREEIARSGFVLRRTAEGVGLELPPLTISTVPVASGLRPDEFDDLEGLEECRRSLGTSVNKGFLETLLRAHARGEEGGIELAQEDLAELQALAQSVSTLLRYLGLCKVAAAADLAEDCLADAPSGKVVIFAKHLQVVDALTHRLAKYNPVIITGATSPGARAAVVDAFQLPDGPRVAVLQIRAAGTAVTLTAADQVIVVETEWDPSSLAQAVKRCHRIGQRRPVTAQILCLASEPLDAAVHAIIARKAREIGAILE